MASEKKRRKQIRITRKLRNPRAAGAPHLDGDRRRRGGLTYDQVMKQKQAQEQFEAQAFSARPPEEEEE
jgi:hypothetical protein